jgi:hypothetical protein
MITAGGSNEANNPSIGQTIRAGGRKSNVVTITQLGTANDPGGLGAVDLSGVDVKVGELLLVAVCAESTFGPNGVDINGIPLLLDLTQVGFTIDATIWHWKATIPIVGGTITVNGNAAVKVCMLATKFDGTNGIFKASAKTGSLPNTANPDSGLATLVGNLPQIHWGIIGTNGNGTDTLGTWQNGMTPGQRSGEAAFSPQLKEGYRSPSPIVQARAQILGQTSRESEAMIAVYA